MTCEKTVWLLECCISLYFILKSICLSHSWSLFKRTALYISSEHKDPAAAKNQYTVKIRQQISAWLNSQDLFFYDYYHHWPHRSSKQFVHMQYLPCGNLLLMDSKSLWCQQYFTSGSRLQNVDGSTLTPQSTGKWRGKEVKNKNQKLGQILQLWIKSYLGNFGPPVLPDRIIKQKCDYKYLYK